LPSFKLTRRIRSDEQEQCEEDTDTTRTPSSIKEQPEIIPPVDADADADADGADDNAKENDTTRNNKDKKEEEEEKETMKKVDEKVDEENNNCPEEKGEEETETEEDKKPAAKEQSVSIEEGKTKKKKTPKTVSCRKVFVFIQQTIASFAHTNPERGIKLYLEAALTADKIGACLPEESDDRISYGAMTYELLSQSFTLYEQYVMTDSRSQGRCVTAMIVTLLACRSLGKKEYEELITRTSKFAAKMIKRSEQCEMVTRCAHLFYVMGEDDDEEQVVVYANPQRCLECLQRALKLADACMTADPSHLTLFVDLLDSYLYFFEKKNPSITGQYITGLVALGQAQATSVVAGGGGGQYAPHTPPSAVGAAKAHFLEIVRHIQMMKQKESTSEHFKDVDVSAIET